MRVDPRHWALDGKVVMGIRFFVYVCRETKGPSERSKEIWGGGRTSYNVDDRWVDEVVDGNIDFSRIQFLLTRARHFLIPYSYFNPSSISSFCSIQSLYHRDDPTDTPDQQTRSWWNNRMNTSPSALGNVDLIELSELGGLDSLMAISRYAYENSQSSAIRVRVVEW